MFVICPQCDHDKLFKKEKRRTYTEHGMAYFISFHKPCEFDTQMHKWVCPPLKTFVILSSSQLVEHRQLRCSI